MTRSEAYRDGFSSRREGGAWQHNPFPAKTPQWGPTGETGGEMPKGSTRTARRASAGRRVPARKAVR